VTHCRSPVRPGLSPLSCAQPPKNPSNALTDLPLHCHTALFCAAVKNERRAQLSWAAQPSDLDLHLVWNGASGDEHIYWQNRKSGDGTAELDVDVTRGFGPETVTIQAECARCIYTCYGEQWHARRRHSAPSFFTL
jgi:uncharacterized protein YfaP (DUF2135 family)